MKPEPLQMTRRRFVKGLAAGTAVAALSPWLACEAGIVTPGTPSRGNVTGRSRYGIPTLPGPEFDLVIEPAMVNITGAPCMAMLINGMLPGPVLHWREGQMVTMRVTNRLNTSTSLHWHGVLVPNAMDGVPGLTYAGIAPGETFTYRFRVRQSGTFWYHSHTRFQLQTGVSAPLVIEPNQPDPVHADRDYVVMLTDWTDENPEALYYYLKTGDDYYNYHKRTIGDFFHDVSAKGLMATLKNRWDWGMMRMGARDIADVSGRQTGGTYTYLVNGQPPAANWTCLFKRGERVRLRFINGSAMTYFDVRIPGMKMTVVAADGSNVEPVSVDEFRIAVAETYDVIVEPKEDAYTIFAEAMDRSGYARATLAVREGLSAPVPPMDPVFSRTMMDMGMAMSGMKGMEGMGGMSGGMDMKGMKGMKGTGNMGGMNMSGMSGMKMSGMSGMGSMGNMAGMGGMGSMGWMPPPRPKIPHSAPANATGQIAYPQPQEVHLHIGPEVVHVAQHPTERLNLPGDGLNNNGRRVLAYTDLVRLATGPQNIPFSERDPDAEVLLHLTGNMARYIFGFNGLTYDQGQAVRYPNGQRFWVTLINDTMMEHPIHLHGMFTELDSRPDRLRPLKHTVSVKPNEKVHYYLTANELGRWAYHCHMLYHMEAGMFTTAIVA